MIYFTKIFLFNLPTSLKDEFSVVDNFPANVCLVSFKFLREIKALNQSEARIWRKLQN